MENIKLTPTSVNNILYALKIGLAEITLEEAESLIEEAQKEFDRQLQKSETGEETPYMENLLDLRDMVETYRDEEIYN